VRRMVAQQPLGFGNIRLGMADSAGAEIQIDRSAVCLVGVMRSKARPSSQLFVLVTTQRIQPDVGLQAFLSSRVQIGLRPKTIFG
jgi:hypothetical protein